MCMELNLVGALYLNPMYTSVATPADYSAPLHTVQFFFLWFIFSSSVPAVQHHRREKDSTTLLIISSISPLACCLLLDSFRSISQFLLSWKFKVSIASLISLKSSSSKWVVGSERVPKSIWSPICLKESAHKGILSTFLLLHSQMSQGRFMSDPLFPQSDCRFQGEGSEWSDWWGT